MNAKENFLRAIERREPEWAPAMHECLARLMPPVVERPLRAGLDAFGVHWSFQESVEGGTLIRKRPTQQDIASMVNSSRETVSRVLNDFQKRGLLGMDGKQVILRPQFYREVG